MKNIVITGGSGLVGRRLSELLIRKGYRIIILSRKAGKATKQLSYSVWDPAKQIIDKSVVAGADYIIHLAGANVMAKRWSASYKEEIIKSRTESAALLLNAVPANHHIQAFISASAIGWYGEDDKKKVPFVETDAHAGDFLGEVCYQWEKAAAKAEEKNIRHVCLRTGIVLSSEEGAYVEFKMPMKAGVAAILGNGKQTVSWIHVDDLCAMYIAAMEDENYRGSYNAVAPAPVSNKELTIAIAEAHRGKYFLPMHVPSFLLKALKGERAVEIIKSCTVSSKKIEQAGFQFQFPEISGACSNLESKS